MLSTKFHDNRPTGFWRRFLKGFYLIWHGGHTGHVTKIILINFRFLVPKNFSYEIWLQMA